jgi:FHA domain/B-box zinc finger
MAKLVIYPGTPQAREFELKPGSNHVGRGFANDFTIEDGSVSTSHAQIVVDGDSVTVKDLGSTNGTFVNRQPVKQAILASGQTLRLGGVEMLFDNPAETAAPATADFVPPPVLGTPLPPIGSESIRNVDKPPPVPPIPPPVGGRVKVGSTTPGGTVMLTPELPPPPIEVPPLPPPTLEAPAAPAAMELPEGKSACKFHKKSPAQWFCQKCRTPFCSLCVTARQTAGSTGYFCRTCGVPCVPVKIKYAVGQEKKPVVYSDVTVLLRSIGFGLGGAVLAAVLWALLAKIMVSLHMRAVYIFIMPPLLCWGTGALTGFAVKTACQDRPGVVFSLIACGFCLVGIFFAGIAVPLALGYMSAFGFWPWALFGTIAGLFSAWKIGGGDF